MSPSSFPPQAPSSDRPLPSAGSPGGSSPTSSVLSADSDFSPPVVRHFVSFAQHYHRFALFAPPGPDDSPRAWTICIAAPAPPLHGGEDEISQVPGRPLRTCPALRPRRTAAPQATTGTPMVPSTFTTASAPPCANFGAPSRGLHALCVRFAAGVTPGQRNTRFRLVASLGRAGLSPAGSHRWFTVMSFRLHSVLHHQALPGAT